MRSLQTTALIVLAGGVAFPPEARGQSCPAISLVPAVNQSLTNPVLVTHAGDGTNRLFLVEKPGVIRVVQPGATTGTIFLRIPNTKLLAGGERGLLGLAFHPDFASNRRYFVNYTAQPNGRTVIAEYKASAIDPNVSEPSATAATETVLFSYPQPFPNHNGGSMNFGPDGFLYISSGDGGDAGDPGNRAQNINTHLGKILRIDVDTPNGPVPYSSPPDNPYAGPTAGLDEIYAIGLRNPWRMSFDRLTGQLLAGDVGQSSREEVDIVTLGGNYGWRVMEGTRCHNSGDALPCNSPVFTRPAFEYKHGSERCSITGGYVYRGTSGALPDGTYIFGDFCTGEIFGLDVADLPFAPGTLPTQPPVLLDTALLITSFGEDEAGEIYAASLDGAIVRIASAVRLSPDTEAFDEIGGLAAVDVLSPNGCPGWTAVANDPWITIESGADGNGNGTVVYRVNANPDVPPRSGTMTIAGQTFHVEQDGGPAPMLSLDDASGPEGSGTVAAFSVSLSLASADTVLVDYVTVPGSASELDFTPASGTISFDPGETTQPLEIELKGDSLDEDDETFVVMLFTPVGAGIEDGEGTGTITDDDAPPSISIASASVAEGFGVRKVPLAVTLSAPSGRAVAVDYTTGPGLATPGADFRAESGTLDFQPGETKKTLFVWIRGDRVDEPDEDVIVDLTGAVNASIATPQATVTLVDDDPAPRPRIH